MKKFNLIIKANIELEDKKYETQLADLLLKVVIEDGLNIDDFLNALNKITKDKFEDLKKEFSYDS